MEKARKVREYKQQLSCGSCGYSHKSRGKKFSTWALQFHHHDHTKEANVGNMLRDGFGLRKIFQEIKKSGPISSLELAKLTNMTLIGRLRGKRFVCLSGENRLIYDAI